MNLRRDTFALLGLTLPLILSGLVQSGVWFFETLFLAHLTPEILAAGALVSWLFGVLISFMLGTLSSINILIAHKFGEKNFPQISLITRDGLLLAILILVPTFFLLRNMAPIFLLLGQSAQTIILTQSYLLAISWGTLPAFLLIVLQEFIIGLGHTKTIFVFSVFFVISNIIASYILIFGKFGFPFLGIAGAGWGMTISYWMTLIVLASFLIFNPIYKNYIKNIFTLSKPFYLHELLIVGIPMGFMFCAEVGFFFVLTICMGLLGTTTLAANQIALQYVGIFGSVMFSIAQALTVRLGHLIGAKEITHAKTASHIGVAISFTFALCLGILYCFFPDLLIRLDFNTLDPANIVVIEQIKKILIVSAIFQIFESARISLFGSLRGLKDTNYSLLASLISFWLIALPLGYILSVTFKIGETGYWWAMTIGAALSMILLQWRFNAKILHLEKE